VIGSGQSLRPFDAVGAGLMLACCIAWGSSLGVGRLGIQGGLPPLTLVAIRAGLAALILVGIVLALRRPLAVPLGLMPTLAVLGFFNTAVTFSLTFVAMAETELPSGLAMVIMCTQPFWVAILGRSFLPDEPLTRRRLVGLAIGFAGVATIAAERLQGGLSGILPATMVLGASFAWTIATIMGRRLGRRIDAWRMTTWQMILATPMLAAFALLYERGQPLVWTVQSVGALIYLTLFATILTMLVWFLLLNRHGAARLTPFVFLQPVSAVLLGVLLGEVLTPLMLVGSALVGFGIVWVNRKAS
jgi:drug/metabolite transporter (DMT)-like permease